MIYTDQHIHCQCSPDSHTPLREMAAAARDHGMSAVCFTDHIDMDFGNLGDLRWEARKDILRAAWADVRANPVEGITVRCGIELGEAPRSNRGWTLFSARCTICAESRISMSIRTRPRSSARSSTGSISRSSWS